MSPTRPNKCFWSITLLLLFSSWALADDGWLGKQVIPKRGTPKITRTDPSGEVITVGIIDYWPVWVREEKGEWVKVQMSNKAGWIQKSEVVRMDEGIQYFTSRIQSNDGLAEAYRKRAWLRSQKGELDIAIKDASEAIRLDPTASTYTVRGNLWLDKKENDKAIQDLDEAIRLDPKRVSAFYNRGLAWGNKKEYDKAIQDYSEAIRLDPKDVMAFTNRGNAWVGKKEYAKAIQDYDEAIRLNSKNALAWNNKAFLLATCADDKLRDVDKAEELLKTGIKLGLMSPWNEETLSVIAAARGRFDEAIKLQNKALEDKDYAAEEGDKARERLKAYEAKKPWRE